MANVRGGVRTFRLPAPPPPDCYSERKKTRYFGRNLASALLRQWGEVSVIRSVVLGKKKERKTTMGKKTKEVRQDVDK